MRVHSPQQLFAASVKQGKAASKQKASANDGSFFSTLQQSLQNIVKKTTDNVASLFRVNIEPAASKINLQPIVKSTPAAGQTAQAPAANTSIVPDVKADQPAVAKPAEERKKNAALRSNTQQTGAAAIPVPAVNSVRAAAPAVQKQSVNVESSSIPLTTESGGSVVPRNPRAISGDAPAAKTVSLPKEKNPKSTAAHTELPDARVKNTDDIISNNSKPAMKATGVKTSDSVQQGSSPKITPNTEQKVNRSVPETKDSAQSASPKTTPTPTNNHIAAASRPVAAQVKPAQAQASQIPNTVAESTTTAKSNTSVHSDQPVHQAAVKTTANTQAMASAVKPSAQASNAIPSMKEISSHKVEMQTGSAPQKVAEQQLAATVKETFPDKPQNNLLRRIGNFWQRVSGGSSAQRNAESSQAPVSTPRTAATPSNSENIPAGRIAQVRESFRNWEKGLDSSTASRHAAAATTILPKTHAQKTAAAEVPQAKRTEQAVLSANSNPTRDANTNRPQVMTVSDRTKNSTTSNTAQAIVKPQMNMHSSAPSSNSNPARDTNTNQPQVIAVSDRTVSNKTEKVAPDILKPQVVVSAAAPTAKKEREAVPSENVKVKTATAKTTDSGISRITESAKAAVPDRLPLSDAKQAADTSSNAPPPKSFWGIKVSAESGNARVPSQPVNLINSHQTVPQTEVKTIAAKPVVSNLVAISGKAEQSAAQKPVVRTAQAEKAILPADTVKVTSKPADESPVKVSAVSVSSGKTNEVRAQSKPSERTVVADKAVAAAEIKNSTEKTVSPTAANQKEVSAATPPPAILQPNPIRTRVRSLFRRIAAKPTDHSIAGKNSQSTKNSELILRAEQGNLAKSSNVQSAKPQPVENKTAAEPISPPQPTIHQTQTLPAKPAIAGERTATAKSASQPMPNVMPASSSESAQKVSTLDPDTRSFQANSTGVKVDPPVPMSAPVVFERDSRAPVTPERGAAPVKQAAAPSEPVAQTGQTNSETPSAAATGTNAQIRESLPVAEAAARPLRTLLTAEHIKELQSLAQRALQSVQTVADGTNQAVFTWSPDNLGPLQFRIITRKDDVEIEIHSMRKDVAEALEEGRGTIERMIGDLGLRVERFDVRVRVPSAVSDQPMTAFHEHYSERNSQAEQDGNSPVLADGADENGLEESLPTRRRLAEHEWVA